MFKTLKKVLKGIICNKSAVTLLVKEIGFDDAGNSKAVIQVIGRPVFFTQKIKDIVKDENLLRQFPPEQIKTLVALWCNENASTPLYKLMAIDHELDEFIVKEVSTDKKFILKIENASHQYLLENFSKQDVFRIGMLFNDYTVRKEYEQICNTKKPTLCIVKNIISNN